MSQPLDIVITGPIGSGRTAVGLAVQALLEKAGLQVTLADPDADSARPLSVDRLSNLAGQVVHIAVIQDNREPSPRPPGAPTMTPTALAVPAPAEHPRTSL